jgi:hypothetical protein
LKRPECRYYIRRREQQAVCGRNALLQRHDRQGRTAIRFVIPVVKRNASMVAMLRTLAFRHQIGGGTKQAELREPCRRLPEIPVIVTMFVLLESVWNGCSPANHCYCQTPIST